jgi:hypothetical protein
MPTPAIQIPLTIAIAPFPEGFKGDMDETFQQAVQLMTGYIEGNFLLGLILPPGSDLPTSDQGPIAMDGVWYFWNTATGEYEPQMFPVKTIKNYVKNCVYQVQQTGAAIAVPAGGGPAYDMSFAQANLVNILAISSINGPAAGPNNDNIPTAINYTVGPGVVTTLLATDLYSHEHLFEGSDIVALRGQKMSLSFWAYGTTPGTYSVYLASSGRDESYTAAFTLTTANQWTWITVPAIPAFPSGGTWHFGEGVTGLYVGFPFGVGANFRITSGNLNKWLGGLNAGTSQNLNLLATAGNALAITGIKLEASLSPTYLSVPAFADDLEILTRYYFTTFAYQSSTFGAPVQFFASQDNNWAATFIFPRRMALLHPVVTPYSYQTQAAGLVTDMFTNFDILIPNLAASRRGITDSGGAVINTSGTLNSTTTITLVATPGIDVGAGVSGNGIPTGATVVKILSSTSLTISAAATISQANVGLTFTNFPPVLTTSGTTSLITTTGDINNGSVTITLEGVSSGIVVGAPVTGAGIPVGATVASAPTGGVTVNTTGTIDGSTKISNIPSADIANITVGMEAVGNGIGAGTTVVQVNTGANSVILSGFTHGLAIGVALTFSMDKTITISVAATGTALAVGLTFGTKKITAIPDTTQIKPGMPVSGLGILPGATVATVDSKTQVTLSGFVNAAGTAVVLVFGAGISRGDLLWAIITADGRLT